MTETEAERLVLELVGIQKKALIQQYISRLIDENGRQNLIGPSTVMTIWNRHVLDSVQIVNLINAQSQTYLDVGSGGGLPGIVVAITRSMHATLCEPRKLRADFLDRMIDQLGLLRARVERKKVADLRGAAFDVITARAVAAAPVVIDASFHLSRAGTRWILPLGRNAERSAQASIHARRLAFHVEQSITDPDSAILVVDRIT